MIKNLLLLKHQKPMLSTIGKIIQGSVKKSKSSNQSFDEVEKTSREFTVTPPVQVVNRYHHWLNTTAKYQDSIAPHLYPQWAIPELYKLGEDFSLPFHKILNQGCKIKVNGKIPKGQNLMGKVQVLEVLDLETKYRINQKIWTGPKENPMALEAEIYAVILKNNKQSFTKDRKKSEIKLEGLTEISKVFVSASDAKNYGLISGDVNPIHMSKLMAKVFGLRSSLMHGFGLKAIIFEELERNGYIVDELEIKFLKPVYLNKNILIYIEKTSNDNSYNLKVLNENKDSVHLLGQLKTKK